MPSNDPQQPLEPRRVKEFAHFFKRYMSVSSVVAAALPIPVTAVGLIPTFSAQTSYLSTYTSMFCFLCLGFVFYTRHQLAPRMFPGFLNPMYASKSSGASSRETTRMQEMMESLGRVLRRFTQAISRMFVPLLPFMLILAALYCSLKYHSTLRMAVGLLRQGTQVSAKMALEMTPFDAIPFSAELEIYYMGIFITAESAFILMAIKEYLQDLVGLTDFTILTGDLVPDGVSPVEVLLNRGIGRGAKAGPTDSRTIESAKDASRPARP